MTATPCTSDGANVGQTHYAECWREHPACAVARVERLEAVLRGVTCEGFGANAEKMRLTLAATPDAGAAFRALLREVGDAGR